MPGKTVLTCGCFDILHIGHVRYLKAAKRLGDYLVVAVNSDESFANYKHRKPFTPELERLEIVASLECVDDAFLFDDPDASTEITKIRPDVFVKGFDWKYKEFTERYAIESVGGKMVFITTTPNRSTTLLVEKIRRNQCQHGNM